jgi:hypothetical protein
MELKFMDAEKSAWFNELLYLCGGWEGFDRAVGHLSARHPPSEWSKEDWKHGGPPIDYHDILKFIALDSPEGYVRIMTYYEKEIRIAQEIEQEAQHRKETIKKPWAWLINKFKG